MQNNRLLTLLNVLFNMDDIIPSEIFINNTIPLYTFNSDIINSGIPLYISSTSGSSSGIPLFTIAEETTANIPLFGGGLDIASSGLSLYSVSFLTTESGIPLYTIGIGKLSSGIPLFTYALPTSGNIPLYINAFIISNNNITLFNKVNDTTHKSGEFPLYLNTVNNSGGFSETFNNTSLFIDADVKNNITLFVGSPNQDANTNNITLYIGAENKTNINTMPLFVEAGKAATMKLYTRGKGYSDANPTLDSNGFYPFLGFTYLFIKRPIIDVIPLFIANNVSSGIIPLYAAGGVSSNGNIPLVIPSTLGSGINSVLTYIHGW